MQSVTFLITNHPFLLILTVVSSSALGVNPSQDEERSNIASVVNNPVNHFHFESNPGINLEPTLNNTTNQTSTHSSEQRVYQSSTQTNLNLIQEKLRKSATGLAQTLLQNKWELALLTCTAAYCTIRYAYSTQIAFLKSPMRWCNWKRTNKTCYVRPQQPLEVIIAELIQAIRVRHLNVSNPLDISLTLAAFAQEIATERSALAKHIQLCRFMRPSAFAYIFRTDPKALDRAKDQLRHLNYLAHLFVISLQHVQQFYAPESTQEIGLGLPYPPAG